MSKTVDYYFSLISPWTYFGDARLKDIAARHDARIVYKPMNLGKVFPITGGLPLAKRSQQRQAYRLAELARWSKHLNLPVNLHPEYFPCDESRAAGMVIATIGNGDDPGDFINVVLSAVWANERNIADDETLIELAARAGLDGGKLLAAVGREDISNEWDRLSVEAIERGVFGSPFYIVNDEPFWGQDRLDMVDAALSRKKE